MQTELPLCLLNLWIAASNQDEAFQIMSSLMHIREMSDNESVAVIWQDGQEPRAGESFKVIELKDKNQSGFVGSCKLY